MFFEINWLMPSVYIAEPELFDDELLLNSTLFITNSDEERMNKPPPSEPLLLPLNKVLLMVSLEL